MVFNFNSRFFSLLLWTTTVTSPSLLVRATLLDAVDYDALDRTWDFVTITDDAAEKGMWTPVKDWPLIAIHTAVLPDGTVLTYGTLWTALIFFWGLAFFLFLQ